MKLRFTSKIRIFILLIFSISLISSLSLFYILNNQNISISIKNDAYNILFFSLFFKLILIAFLFSVINKYLKKDLFPIKQIIDEITKGNYNFKLEESYYIDNEIDSLMTKMQKMIESILFFDNLKKEKIVEHRNRVISMLNISDSGFMIFNIKGNIMYVSDIVRVVFPAIEENTNIFNVNYNQEIESTIKKVVIQIMKTGQKAESQSHYFHSMKRHLTIKSSLIRDSRGIPIGFALAINNLSSYKKEVFTNQETKDPENFN